MGCNCTSCTPLTAVRKFNPLIEVSNKLKLCVRLYKDMFCSKSAKTNDELISQLKGKLLRQLMNVTILKNLLIYEDTLMFLNFNSLLSERREIKCSKTEKVMRLVDRGDFAKDDLYEDCPQYIGCGATISAPHMVS